MRDIFLLTITYMYEQHVDTQIIDAPNLEAALAYAKEQASHHFSTDRGWSQDEWEDWVISGCSSSNWKAHLQRAEIHRLNDDGYAED